MTVGLVFDLHAAYPWQPGDPADADVEYEPEETVQALETALHALGHQTHRIGTPAGLLRDGPGPVDAAVNIAEGVWTRNREGWAPTLLEMWGIPFLGSDALALSISLDKVYAKELVEAAGVRTPAFVSLSTAEEARWVDLPFPLFVKPRLEGTAKGIRPGSVVGDSQALEREVAFVTGQYNQPALVETYVEGGGEFTVAVVGAEQPRALPVLQRAIDRETGIGLHALERFGERDWMLGGSIEPVLEVELQRLSILAFSKLGCKDFARVDFRVDGEGLPWFLEINPLPTFAPDGTFAVIAELMGLPYEDLLAEVLSEALDRALAERHPVYAEAR